LGTASSRAAEGFTLIEVLVVLAIISILGAIALPWYLDQRDKAIYTDALVQMRGMVPLIRAYQAREGRFPPDVLRNTAPEGFDQWLPTDPLLVPFGSQWDYDNIVSGEEGDRQIVTIRFFGRNGRRDTPPENLNAVGDDTQVLIFDSDAGN